MDGFSSILISTEGKERQMANDTEKKNELIRPKQTEALLIDEFEIIELENRLELAGRCNGRCDAQ
jgi:hypothetical protein